MVYVPLLTIILLATTVLVSSSSESGMKCSCCGPGTPSNTSDAQCYCSGNYAGAKWSKSPGTFKAVTGTFVVPTPKAPKGDASIWVGIDSSAILQTGIRIFNENGEAPSYVAWYEWYPLPGVQNFTDFPINSGDTIKLTVTATSNTTGIAAIENLTTNQTASQPLSSSDALTMTEAEWIVEDYGAPGGGKVPFTNFGTVDFIDAYATMVSDETVSPNGAEIFIFRPNLRKGPLTCVTENPTGVTIRYL